MPDRDAREERVESGAHGVEKRLPDHNASLAPSPPTSATAHPSIVLALVTTAQFMGIVDFFVIQIALPTIHVEFNADLASIQWITSAYGITVAGFLMLSGRMGDLYGRKRLFMIGIIMFTATSLIGGLSPNLTLLIIARAIQGIGAAISSATALSILTAAYPAGKERNRAIAIFGSVSSSGFIIGLIVGGVVTAELGWRWVLFINVPIGIVTAILAARYLSEMRDRVAAATGRVRLDLPGAITVTAGLMLLVYALTNVANMGLTSLQTISLSAAAVVVLILFLLIERRSKAPLVPLSFLSRGSVFSANAVALLLSGGTRAGIFVMSFYLQQTLGYSALFAGLAFLPNGTMGFVSSGIFSQRLVVRIGMKLTLIAGTLTAMIGPIFLSHVPLHGDYFRNILPWLIFWSTGWGIAYVAAYIAALNDARRGEEGLASGMVNTSIQVGGPIGIACVVAVAGIVTQSANQLNSPTSTLIGFQYGFIVAATLLGIAAIMSLFVKSKKENGNDDGSSGDNNELGMETRGKSPKEQTITKI